MTTKIEDLWPNDLVNLETPSLKEILMEQANYLSEKTKNLLVGEVITRFSNVADNKGGAMVHEFIIKAPSMGNYQFVLLKVTHDFSIYPVRINDELNDNSHVASDETEFKQKLSEILSSSLLKNAIRALVGQSLIK